jgi:hypothetical protein
VKSYTICTTQEILLRKQYKPFKSQWLKYQLLQHTRTPYYFIQSVSVCFTNSCSDTKEIPNILWNQKVHYPTHKIPSLIPILRQINSDQNFHTISQRYIFMFSHLRPGLRSGRFHSGFLTNPLCALLSNECYKPCPYNPPRLDNLNNITRNTSYEAHYVQC